MTRIGLVQIAKDDRSRLTKGERGCSGLGKLLAPLVVSFIVPLPSPSLQGLLNSTPRSFADTLQSLLSSYITSHATNRTRSPVLTT